MTITKLIKGGILAAVIAAASPLAMAEEELKTPGSGPNPFTDCGIGAALFPTVGWAAVTSNVIWDVGTTALTSATASPQTCSGKEVETAQFIIDNYDNLVEEASQGEGTHLNAMLDIMGCNAGQSQGIVSNIRSEMAVRVNQAQYSEQNLVVKASGFYDAVSTATASSCSA